MKSHLKIKSLGFLTAILICSGVSGRNIVSMPAKPVEDTSGLNRMVRVDSFLLPILTPSSGVQFYKDKIVFLSKAKNERKMTPDHISFGAVEAYYAAVEDSVTGRHLLFSSGSSFTYPCEAMTFSNDYKTLYFSKPETKAGKEKIFISSVGLNEKNEPELSAAPVMLDFCTGNFNYTHPALSSDGNILIYASDREGSLGGMDLFISRLTGGKWSAPENLGKAFNTTGNEFFPFLDQDNNLYFSSDKLPGQGGYDVFRCKFNGEGWNIPANMPVPLNSPYDDMAFTINKTDGKSGFITRKSGNNNVQLFRISAKPQVSEKNLVAIFNGPPAMKTDQATAYKADKEKTEPLMAKTDTLQAVKPEAKVPESNKAVSKPPDAKSVIIKPTLPIAAGQKDVVIYRVQILSANKPKREKSVMLNGESYDLYEYFYMGSYRYSIGEFKTLQPALDLQRICRKTDYPQAFVAGFKNNTRSTDLKSFK
jgi:hypothetical protein